MTMSNFELYARVGVGGIGVVVCFVGVLGALGATGAAGFDMISESIQGLSGVEESYGELSADSDYAMNLFGLFGGSLAFIFVGGSLAGLAMLGTKGRL